MVGRWWASNSGRRSLAISERRLLLGVGLEVVWCVVDVWAVYRKNVGGFEGLRAERRGSHQKHGNIA